MNEAKLHKALGTRVATLRRERDMTQHDLAGASKLSVEQVGRLERGDQIPLLTTLSRVAAGLGIPLADLFDFQQLRKPSPAAAWKEIGTLLDELKSQPASLIRLARDILKRIVDDWKTG